jgi:hypothetical protein
MHKCLIVRHIEFISACKLKMGIAVSLYALYLIHCRDLVYLKPNLLVVNAKLTTFFVRFEVFMAATMKNGFFWNVGS